MNMTGLNSPSLNSSFPAQLLTTVGSIVCPLQDLRALFLSASMSADVLDILIEDFHLRETSDLFFRGAINRHLPTHSIQIVPKSQRNDYSDLLRATTEDAKRGPGLIYALQKNDAEALCEALQAAGIRSDFIHSDRSKADKKRVRCAWLDDRLDVVVATEAFGLGVDKRGIAFVHHADPPLSLLCLQQHLGRARSTRTEVRCAIFWHEKDFDAARSILRLKIMGTDQAQRSRDLVSMYRFLLDGSLGCLRKEVILAAVPDPQSAAASVEPCGCCHSLRTCGARPGCQVCSSRIGFSCAKTKAIAIDLI